MFVHHDPRRARSNPRRLSLIGFAVNRPAPSGVFSTPQVPISTTLTDSLTAGFRHSHKFPVTRDDFSPLFSCACALFYFRDPVSPVFAALTKTTGGCVGSQAPSLKKYFKYFRNRRGMNNLALPGKKWLKEGIPGVIRVTPIYERPIGLLLPQIEELPHPPELLIPRLSNSRTG